MQHATTTTVADDALAENDRATAASLSLRAFWGAVVAVILVAQGATSALIELRPMAVLNEFYPMWRHAAELARQPRQTPDAIALFGDSRLKAGVLPHALGAGVRAMTLPGGTPFTLDVLLRRYLEAGPAPEQLVLSVSPVHLASEVVFWEHALKFELLSHGDVDEFHATLDRLGDASYGNPFERRMKTLFTRLHMLPIYYPELSHAVAEDRASRNREVLAELHSTGGYSAFGTAERFEGSCYEATEPSFRVFPIMNLYLRQLLRRAVSSGAKTFFVVLPLTDGALRRTAPGFRADFRRMLRSLQKDFPEVRFDTDFPVYEPDYFGDANHLNRRGAERYTETLRARLEPRGAEPPAAP